MIRRRIVLSIVVTALAGLGLASIAFAAKQNRATKSAAAARCGTRYTPRCTAPSLTVRQLTLVCHAPRSTFTLPTVSSKSNAGIRSVTVKLGSRTIYVKKYSGQGPTSVSVSRLKVNTSSLGSGLHTITVTTVDIKGKRVTRTLRFTVCKPAPIFTG